MVYSSCPTSTYGIQCLPCSCSPAFGVCSDGITGNGSCSACFPGRYGQLCENACSCPVSNMSQCLDGISGTGECVCSSTTMFGPTCSLPCTCANGTCSSGSSGTGLCLSCNPGYFGQNCDQACTCTSLSACSDGITGNGTCKYCDSTTYGPNCQNSCSCTNGVCNSGVGATTTIQNGISVAPGSCLVCLPGWAGPDCKVSCTCVNGICDDGINGTIAFTLFFFAAFFLMWESLLTWCKGTGTCLKCNPGFYGPNCATSCSSTCIANGVCSDGINGNF